MEKKLVVIVGPTAVGKTSLALKVASRFQTEIVSADSRQVFRELTIGTAKPTLEELAKIPHHFIDSHSIKQHFDAAQYGEEALAVIRQLFTRHDLVVMCGGSGLYIKAALEGFDDIPKVDETTRKHVSAQYELYGIQWLRDELNRVDPGQLDRLDVDNPARLIRALEVKLSSGISISSFHRGKTRELDFRVIKVGLTCDRETLYKRIDQRMDEMIEKGLFEEADHLYEFREHNALQTVGYQEIFEHISGEYDRDEAIRLLKRNSRRYAKRQLTWFGKDETVVWFDAGQTDDVVSYIENHTT